MSAQSYLRRTKPMEIKPISIEQQEQLSKIATSQDWTPCQVTLSSGVTLDNVYLANHDEYLRSWGRINKEMLVPIEEVISIEESPNALPVSLSKKLYDAGESGMGYCVFKIVYDTGATLDVVTGNAVDFVPSPEGLTIRNIVDVLPHEGSRQAYLNGLDYKWCLFKGL